MLKLSRLWFCSVKQTTPPELEFAELYYKSGKSVLSISQQIVQPALATKLLFPNYYIREEICSELENISPGFQVNSMQDRQISDHLIPSIFRLLVRGNIGNKDLGLNINSLKANLYIKKLMQLKENKKFVTKTSQIVIDDEVIEKPGTDISPILNANLLEVEKLIETGLDLPISFMISKSNVSSQSWLKCLVKKRKAIHSDIIECSAPGNATDKKPIGLEQFVYTHGFRLEHLFLRPYQRGCPTGLLATNDSFNLEQLLKVLYIINFEGKIVLENTEHFAANVEFLDGCLKKCGYQRRKTGQIDLINQYMIL